MDYKQLTAPIAEKVKKPFILSYLLVWCYNNWELILNIILFDKQTLIAQKKTLITDFLPTDFYCLAKSILCNIGYTFLLIITGGLVFIITYILTSFFERQLKLKISEFFDKHSVVSKEKHESLKNRFQKLEITAQEEEEKRVKFQLKYEAEVELRLKQDQNLKDSQSNDFFNEINDENLELKEQIVKLKKQFSTSKNKESIETAKNIILSARKSNISNKIEIGNFASFFSQGNGKDQIKIEINDPFYNFCLYYNLINTYPLDSKHRFMQLNERGIEVLTQLQNGF